MATKTTKTTPYPKGLGLDSFPSPLQCCCCCCCCCCCFWWCFWPYCWQWRFFFWSWGYKMVLLSVHIYYRCWWRCWRWDWCGAVRVRSTWRNGRSVPHWGWSDRGWKWCKLSIGWYRVGYRWVLPIFLQKQRIKWNPIWNWWPLFIWAWILGYRLVMVPYRLCRFRELPQSSRQLLTTLIIQ